MAHFKLATYPSLVKRTRRVDVGPVSHYVEYVPYGQDADITFNKHTKDHKHLNSRPFVTKSASYKTLQAAVRSLLKSSH